MLFSSPDYPIYLIAVFTLYALARLGGPRGALARVAVMVLLGDVVFVLVSKDLGALWDPLGGLLLRLATGPDPAALAADPSLADHPLRAALGEALPHAWQWPIGLAVLGLALRAGRRHGGWLTGDAGQRVVARGLVAAVAVVGGLVATGWLTGALPAITHALGAGGHLVVLLILGVALGAAQVEATRPLGRVLILFIASTLFYQAWAAAMPGAYRYLLALLLGTIVLDYYLGIWIEEAQGAGARRALLLVSVASNLGILFFFKYADFFTQDVLRLPVGRLHLLLPAGISFHTFQSLSYTIDVYRRQLKATRSVVTFATFVLFFPQLVAGPIVRAQELLPQLEALPPLELERATAGIFRIVVGLFKKIALADRLAMIIVERVFEAPERFSAVEVLFGIYGYALQIYLDFSAYSDIAIGSAQLLGFELPENFRTPYRSSNLQEFWRRWHISLSTWLRDNLYIPLGGNHGAPWLTYRNLILTMVLGGLWHGASWAFIVWGALHGFGLAVTRLFQRRAGGGDERRMLAAGAAVAVVGATVHRLALTDAGTWPQLVAMWLYLTPLWAALTAWLSSATAVAPCLPGPPAVALALRLAMLGAGLGALRAVQDLPPTYWLPAVALCWGLGVAADVVARGGVTLAEVVVGIRRALAIVLTFHYVCLAWVFFRATSFDNALAVLRQLGGLETDHANLVPVVQLTIVAGLLGHAFPDGSFGWLRARFVALSPMRQGVLLAAAALILRELAIPTIVPFIYFQF